MLEKENVEVLLKFYKDMKQNDKLSALSDNKYVIQLEELETKIKDYRKKLDDNLFFWEDWLSLFTEVTESFKIKIDSYGQLPFLTVGLDPVYYRSASKVFENDEYFIPKLKKEIGVEAETPTRPLWCESRVQIGELFEKEVSKAFEENNAEKLCMDEFREKYTNDIIHKLTKVD
ncbi:hypothetical protein OS493_005645 [Desmophyllum pertusum]|uniref:Uncharacterized protein n=1 Tax=Desmophyllum pertusum TaxID=174260 RepID=A0A9X0CNV2_9CNID|nr:hypothetical protein OS493_005645 [Desmophyllum pertusum]